MGLFAVSWIHALDELIGWEAFRSHHLRCGLSSSVSSAAHSIGVWKRSAPSLKLRMPQDEPESAANLFESRSKAHLFVNLPDPVGV